MILFPSVSIFTFLRKLCPLRSQLENVHNANSVVRQRLSVLLGMHHRRQVAQRQPKFRVCSA